MLSVNDCSDFAYSKSGLGLRLRNLVGLALLTMYVLSTASTGVAAPATRALPTLLYPHARPWPPALPVRTAGLRRSATSTTYKLTDYGAPLGSSASNAVAFNNSGQILGSAIIAKKGAVDCVIGLGVGRFVDVTPSTVDTGCFPSGISNVGSTGVVHFVGELLSEYVSHVAFAGSYSTSTGAGTVHPFTANVSSDLIGVNAGGEAVGNGAYAPLGWTAHASSLNIGQSFLANFLFTPFVVPAGTTSFDVMQPSCYWFAPTHLCGSSLSFVDQLSGCPFGGCEINDAGTVLAIDLSNSHLMTFVYGQPSSAKDLNVVETFGVGTAGILDCGCFLNNVGQATATVSTKSGVVPVIYSISTGKTTIIPPLAGQACATYVPLSLSNTGEVLGYADATPCGNGMSSYWTWDSKHGTQNLTAELPKSSYLLQPLGVNDHGQILVNLDSLTTSAPLHWGVLSPP